MNSEEYLITDQDTQKNNGGKMKINRCPRILIIIMVLTMTAVFASCGGGNGPESGSGVPVNTSFALVNPYNEFLSVDSDGRTLILSDEPYMWRLMPNGGRNHIISDEQPDFMFDLSNAAYEEGTAVNLYEDTGDDCQYWEFTAHGNGYVITSAEEPEWCVLSAQKGFTLGKLSDAGDQDLWRISKGEGWEEASYPEAEDSGAEPEEPQPQSYTPTPEFWETFDAEGITEEMIAESVHHGTNCAQYLMIDPDMDDPGEGYDFFSVDFYTENMPDYTYWSLANWDMNKNIYMERNGYDEYDTVGAYGGLQDVGDYNTKIMSIWETYFSNRSGSKYTLVPECVYPSGKSTSFDNEGSGTSLVAPFDWQAGTWYRYVLRSWQANDTTYVGSWVEDLDTGEVTLLAVYDTFLPESFISNVPSQFLEDYHEDSYGEYRQMKLKNFCVRGADSQNWYYIENVQFTIWSSLGYNQGTFRYTADGDTVIGETCGLGEDACAGLSDDDITKTYRIRSSHTAPDPDRYVIPEL